MEVLKKYYGADGYQEFIKDYEDVFEIVYLDDNYKHTASYCVYTDDLKLEVSCTPNNDEAPSFFEIWELEEQSDIFISVSKVTLEEIEKYKEPVISNVNLRFSE